MRPTRRQIELDVMNHFAFRHARPGSVFDLKGFWRLTIPRYLLTDRDFEDAMAALLASGQVTGANGCYCLTVEGASRMDHVLVGNETA